MVVLLVSGTGPGEAQDLAASSGKLFRVMTDGSPASDNPFIDNPDARPEIYSYGHRDISGIATHPHTGDIWITEHGPRGGDELNVIRSGANYGWQNNFPTVRNIQAPLLAVDKLHLKDWSNRVISGDRQSLRRASRSTVETCFLSGVEAFSLPRCPGSILRVLS